MGTKLISRLNVVRGKIQNTGNETVDSTANGQVAIRRLGVIVFDTLTASDIVGGVPSDASLITYTPADLTNWSGSVDPGNVDDALDQLADRVFTVESGAGIDHGGLSGLSDDDHTQYALLAGRAGGQTLIGGTGASESLILKSTSHGTKGPVVVTDKLYVGFNGSAAGEIRLFESGSLTDYIAFKAGTLGGATTWTLPTADAAGVWKSDGAGNLSISAVAAADVTGLGTMAAQNANSVTITGGTINGTVIGGSTPAAGTFTAGQFTGNLTVDGDLLVSGNTITFDTATVTVEDPLIKLAKSNAAHAVDIGLYGLYKPAATDLYAGLFFDATDSKWKLFSGLEVEPTTTVNTAGTGYTVATLVANLEGNADTVAVADAAGDTTTWPMLARSQTGNQAPTTDAGLTYNATTNTLTATIFSGTATLATTATSVEVTDASSDSTMWILLSGFQTSSSTFVRSDAELTYDASTNTIGCVNISATNNITAGGSVNGGSIGTLTSTALTNTTTTVVSLNHSTSGIPAAGFGVHEYVGLETTTTEFTAARKITTTWVDATHATRKARVVHGVYDTAERECLRMEASGSAAMIGVLGASAVVQQTGDVAAALTLFGFMDASNSYAATKLGALNTLTNETVLADDDELVFYDTSAAANRNCTLASLRTSLALALGDNLLINGGFDIFQRSAPGTAKAMTDDTYNGPDRWYSLVQGAGATLERSAGFGNTKYALKLTAGGTTNRHGVAQIVESFASIAARGQPVTLQFAVKPTMPGTGTETMDVRVAVLEWTGTADTVTSDPINDWTSSTYTTGNFFASTSLTLVGTAKVSVTESGTGTATVSGTVSSSCNNLIVVLWTEDVPSSALNTLEVAEAGLYIGSSTHTWFPRPIATEVNLCQRYFEKSYAIDTAPGTVTNSSSHTQSVPAAGNLNMRNPIRFIARKRAAPTMTAYDAAGTSGRISEFVSDVQANGISGFQFNNTGETQTQLLRINTNLNGVRFQWTADAEL